MKKSTVLFAISFALILTAIVLLVITVGRYNSLRVEQDVGIEASVAVCRS